MTKQIRWRLAATYLIVIFLAMSILGMLLSYSVERQFVSEVHTALRAHANLCRSRIEEHITTNVNPGDLDEMCRILSSEVNAHVLVTANGGTVLGSSESSGAAQEEGMPESMRELRKRFGCVICHSEVKEHQTDTISLPVRHAGARIGEISLSASLYQAKLAAGKTRRIILAALIITGLIAAMISMHLASTIAGPISHMNAMALQMASGDLSQRVDVKLQDEVGQLAGSLNIMALRLSDNLDQLAQERDKMQTILATMADGIVVTDRSGLIVLFNKAAERLFGIDSASVLGKEVEVLSNMPEIPDMARRVLSDENPTPKELRTSRPAERILNAYVAPVHDQDGGIAGSLAVLQDVTEIRRQAEYRKDFVGNVSHELRTPLATVRAIVGALQSGAMDEPEARARFLENLDAETDRLSLLLNDLLNLAELESGKLALNRSMVSIRDAAHQAVTDLSDKAQQYRVSVSVEVPEDLAAYVDEQHLLHVMLNLVDNAVKYTGEGGSVVVTGEATKSEVLISVRDTGTGIPPADLDRIFERFYRVDKARSRRLGGTGLGLSIVRDIMNAHGGRVAVESKLGKGSTFTVAFPRVKHARIAS